MIESPDFAAYVDLTVWDTDVQRLVNQARTDAVTKFPGWVPQEPDIAVLLLESLATVVDELAFMTNRVPDAILTGLLALMGATLNIGVACTATVTVTAGDLLGHTLPLGSQFVLTLNGPIPQQVILQTTAALTIAAAATTGTVAVTATANGVAANGVAAGTALGVVASTAWIDRAVLATAVTAGADPETSTAFLLRASQRMRRITDSYVRAEDLQARALEAPAAVRARCVDRWDGNIVNQPGLQLGYSTVVVCGANLADIGATPRGDLLTELQAGSPAHLTVVVQTARSVVVNITAQVKGRGGYTSAQVIADVAAQLASWLNPDIWPWDAVIYPNEILAQIDRALTVDYVINVLAPVAPTVLFVDQLPVLGTLTITVT